MGSLIPAEFGVFGKSAGISGYPIPEHVHSITVRSFALPYAANVSGLSFAMDSTEEGDEAWLTRGLAAELFEFDSETVPSFFDISRDDSGESVPAVAYPLPELGYPTMEEAKHKLEQLLEENYRVLDGAEGGKRRRAMEKASSSDRQQQQKRQLRGHAEITPAKKGPPKEAEHPLLCKFIGNRYVVTDENKPTGPDLLPDDAGWVPGSYPRAPTLVGESCGSFYLPAEELFSLVIFHMPRTKTFDQHSMVQTFIHFDI